jgi:hypothetical protein
VEAEGSNGGSLLQIRKKMTEIMAREASTCDLKELVLKFIPESIGKDIEKVRTALPCPFTNFRTRCYSSGPSAFISYRASVHLHPCVACRRGNVLSWLHRK